MRREGHQFADDRQLDRSTKPQELSTACPALQRDSDAPATLSDDLLSSLNTSDHARSSSRFSFAHNQIASATRVFHQRQERLFEMTTAYGPDRL